ncbi:methyltransferase domain-containing protein [Paenibacillus radicis (ex Xue et al. 2023)]|uniref:Methyltransferase domain-containing protein n=1 Tax=Paenibacillus radicis (ex Xue et al. 2023) TaxID=2972489 RepID=A0ABT1YAA4_9BACL|nr:methyltransferase domain-containing protein [Paenibacillus radicis (ex Xue et al. 2023)]MCR8630121.1 methyltransferase domain-containing protein [Paenibacillus radicis (ex Xue et al. 2023)]
MPKLLFDPMKHPDWIPPQTAEWHANLASETGRYKYPWNSVFDEPRAEVIFADKIAAYLKENVRVLDVGCGHGEFTKTFAHKAKEVMGIDINEEYIASAIEETGESVTFFVVDADKRLPFPDDSFDVVYTKKGPWLFHKGIEEGHRVIKPGGIVLGLYHCGTDGGLRNLFPGLYYPFPDSYLEDIKAKFERQLSESNLEKIELQIYEEIEYLSRPEDVLIKKCFGQKETLKKIVWQECLKQVEEIFLQYTTPRGLMIVNYHALMIGRAR